MPFDPVPCPRCSDHGASFRRACTRCEGSGQIERYQQSTASKVGGWAWGVVVGIFWLAVLLFGALLYLVDALG